MMKKLITHPLLWALIVTAALYVLFAHILNPPLPKSLLIQYMVICIAGILMVVTFSDATASRFAYPMRALLGAPKLFVLRMAALIIVVAGVGGLTFLAIKPNFEAPVELRTVHPAPPSSIKVYGKSFNLLKLENPLRKKAREGSEEFKTYIKEGSDLYFKNCVFCHGDLLDGKGHFAAAFNPRPINFQDVGTIAQLQESFLFWRITTGGPGLPREGAPWASAMPVWHEMLKEEEVWKLILFLYDYTGYVPRSWELAEPKGMMDKAGDKPAKKAKSGVLDEEAIVKVYAKRCAQCHGDDGDGQGVGAELMYPKPRDFTLAVFKYKTTHADNEFPTDDDLRKTIRDGLAGTAMPGWKSILSKAEIDGLIQYIKQFGGWDEENLDEPLKLKPIDEGEVVAASPESIARGARLFQKTCTECHGLEGRGNITSGKKLKDDWQDRIWPRNLTRPETWRWTHNAKEVFQRISTGIRGTPMPEHTTPMSVKERWDVANYVMTLREKAQPLAKGETVIRAARIEGELPVKTDDPAWQKALPMTFAMAPNVIKEGRMFKSLNNMVTVRALFNDKSVALRMDVDDRTYSVPGSELEKKYRIEGVEPTHDAVAVQFPVTIPQTSEKPWFRHGDKKHPVNMWYWRAAGEAPKAPETVMMLDANGPDAAPLPREGYKGLNGKGEWKGGQWRVVLSRPLKTEDVADLQFETGRYIPVAFANWDGVAGEKGSRHSFTTWYWLLLEPQVNMPLLYAASGGAGLLAGLVFFFAARRQRRYFS